MRNNNYLGLNNFKVKTSSAEIFLNEHGAGCSKKIQHLKKVYDDKGFILKLIRHK